MVMSLDEPIRRLIDGFAVGEFKLPTRIGSGNVYFVPSESDLGEFYIVAYVMYTESGKTMHAWVCGCKAFRFGQQGDYCKHIRKVQDGIETGIKVKRRKKAK